MKNLRKAPKPRPKRIRARPWETTVQEHLDSIMKRLRVAADQHQYCNLSPVDCDLLLGSINATAEALDSATSVVRQIAREHYGEEAEKMTTKDFADRQGYDS